VAAAVNVGVLAELARQFLLLSLLSIGGANSILPEVQRRAVEVEGWMTNADFAQMFALSQAAPGPNVLIVSLVGWKAAGYVGAIVAMVAMCVPSSLLTYQVAHAWDRFRDAPWRIATQVAVAPVTVGLILASGYVLTRTIDHDWQAYVLTATIALVAFVSRIHPLWLLGVGAALGALGYI
jgi:chromate transporter